MREAGLEPGDDVRVRMVGPGRIELVKTEELIEQFAGRLDSKAEATSAKPLSAELDAGAAGLA